MDEAGITDIVRPVEWRISGGLVPYPEALATMEARVEAIVAGRAPELVWLLEHPPLYTAGTSANPADLLAPDRFPVYAARRGGQYTYHGPGQRVAYAMLDLDRRGRSGAPETAPRPGPAAWRSFRRCRAADARAARPAPPRCPARWRRRARPSSRAQLHSRPAGR